MQQAGDQTLLSEYWIPTALHPVVGLEKRRFSYTSIEQIK
jgi:hypothetical protein